MLRAMHSHGTFTDIMHHRKSRTTTHSVGLQSGPVSTPPSPQTVHAEHSALLITNVLISVLEYFTNISLTFILLFTAQCTSAKRGLAIACRLAVCLWRYCGLWSHIGWKSRKVIARTISPTLRFSQPKGHLPTPRDHGGIFGETKNLTKKTLWRGMRGLIFRVHRAVTFAIAQLSCWGVEFL